MNSAVCSVALRGASQVLACMHGSAWKGDEARLLRALAQSLSARELAAAA